MPQQDIILFSEIKFKISDVSAFSISAKIENSKNSEIVSRLVKLIDFFCLFEGTGNSRDFRGFGFNPNAEIKNSGNFSKYFQC